MNEPQQPSIAKHIEKKYGKTIADYGFTIIPNDLLRNFKTLGLTPAQSLVLIEILSIGELGASAGLIASWTNLHPDTVRDAFRLYESKGLLKRWRYANGDVNHFNDEGLVKIIKQFGEKRQRSKYLVDRGIPPEPQPPMVNPHTIKELKESKDLKEGTGYRSFLDAGKKLKKKM